MRSTRRRFLLGTAGLALLGGCSDPRSEGTPTIAFVLPNTSSNFSVEMGLGFQAGAGRVEGVESSVSGPEIADGPKQVEIFQSLADDRIDGISYATLSPELFARPLAAAGKEGIPIIAVDIGPPPASGVRLFVGNDNYELGQKLADEAVARLPASATGVVVLGTSAPGVPALDFRAEGMRDRLQEKLPGLSVAGPFDTSQDVPANRAAWGRLIKANPNALAFLGTGDADAYNLALIRQEQRATWLAGAFDLDTQSLTAVRAGQLFAVISPEHFLKGAVAGRIQADRAKSGKALPEGWVYIPGLAVTKDNVEQIITRQASTEARSSQLGGQVDEIVSSVSDKLRKLDDAR